MAITVTGFASPLIAEKRQATSRPAGESAKLAVALLQMKPDGNNQAANLAKAERFCRDAAAKRADIALMPEMWSVGYGGYDRKKPNPQEAFAATATPTDGPWVQHFARLAKELRMAIAVTYLQAWENLPRNAMTLFDRNGKELFTYAKVHTCDFAHMEAATTPGTDFYVAELDTRVGPVKVGAMICFDRENPESARILMLKGAELILTPNACGLEEMRLDQFKIRAWENAVDVAMTNYPQPNNNGNSVAFDFEGHRLVEPSETEALLLASFDLTSLRKYRSATIWGNSFRRPHRYSLLASPARESVWDRKDANGQPFDPAKR